MLRLSWAGAIRFISMVEPYLILKWPQAHVALVWDIIRPRQKFYRTKLDYVRALNFLREELTYLNARGSVNDGIEEPLYKVLRGTIHAS